VNPIKGVIDSFHNWW